MPEPPVRPNVVLILADDMGYSDLGCYGGEIRTPNLDRLASEGVRFSSFYNTSRCSPSRASLLTGLHPHQTGVGILNSDDRPRGYPGALNDRCATIAEALKATGYATCLSGKWHLASEVREPNDAWPTRRGFDRFFGTLSGGGSYFQPRGLMREERNVEDEALRPGFYYTDAISDEACAFLRDHRQSSNPFFLYAAYTAPHWPLHALEADIASYCGTFDEGWDVLRDRRKQRLIASGILDESAALSQRDSAVPAWRDVADKAWETRRMEVYAAQLSRMDAGVGRILATLEENDQLSNTLVIFLSDNGASAEPLPLWGDVQTFKKQRPNFTRFKTRDGREVHLGNDPLVMPGGEDSFASYGPGWANLSNTPFRYFKRWTHEGGIATPLIVRWPEGQLKNGSIVRTPFQLTDVMPTILHAARAPYPVRCGQRQILPCQGRSFLDALRGHTLPTQALYWEHVGNAAIRSDRWKLVREWSRPWELYDTSVDRSELINVADCHPEIVNELAADWESWADRVGVIPFETTIDIYAKAGRTPLEAAG